MNPVNIMHVPVHPVTNAGMTEELKKRLAMKRCQSIMTPNPEMVMTAQKNHQLMDALCSADLVIPDGIGLIIASRIKRLGLLERVTGIDTMEKVLKLCDEHKKSIFLLGGKPGRAEKAVQNICQRYPGIRAAGSHHGYFKDEEEKHIISCIRQEAPDVLFVCLGSPRQEIWIHRHIHELPCRLVMGVGGSVDVHAGEVKRAPVLFQKAGLEWLYRLWQEPTRIGRMLILPTFLWRSLWLKSRKERK